MKAAFLKEKLSLLLGEFKQIAEEGTNSDSLAQKQLIDSIETTQQIVNSITDEMTPDQVVFTSTITTTKRPSAPFEPELSTFNSFPTMDLRGDIEDKTFTIEHTTSDDAEYQALKPEIIQDLKDGITSGSFSWGGEPESNDYEDDDCYDEDHSHKSTDSLIKRTCEWKVVATLTHEEDN